MLHLPLTASLAAPAAALACSVSSGRASDASARAIDPLGLCIRACSRPTESALDLDDPLRLAAPAMPLDATESLIQDHLFDATRCLGTATTPGATAAGAHAPEALHSSRVPASDSWVSRPAPAFVLASSVRVRGGSAAQAGPAAFAALQGLGLDVDARPARGLVVATGVVDARPVSVLVRVFAASETDAFLEAEPALNGDDDRAFNALFRAFLDALATQGRVRLVDADTSSSSSSSCTVAASLAAPLEFDAALPATMEEETEALALAGELLASSFPAEVRAGADLLREFAARHARLFPAELAAVHAADVLPRLRAHFAADAASSTGLAALSALVALLLLLQKSESADASVVATDAAESSLPLRDVLQGVAGAAECAARCRVRRGDVALRDADAACTSSSDEVVDLVLAQGMGERGASFAARCLGVAALDASRALRVCA